MNEEEHFFVRDTCLAMSHKSSSSYHGVGSLVDPFWSHTSRSLFSGLPWYILLNA